MAENKENVNSELSDCFPPGAGTEGTGCITLEMHNTHCSLCSALLNDETQDAKSHISSIDYGRQNSVKVKASPLACAWVTVHESSCFTCKHVRPGHKTHLEADSENHLNGHAGPKLYSCGKCRRSFSRKSRLVHHERFTRHVQDVPSRPSSPEPEPEPEECVLQTELPKEVIKVVKPKIFHCIACDKGFTRKSNLTKHEKKFHAQV